MKMTYPLSVAEAEVVARYDEIRRLYKHIVRQQASTSPAPERKLGGPKQLRSMFCTMTHHRSQENQSQAFPTHPELPCNDFKKINLKLKTFILRFELKAETSMKIPNLTRLLGCCS